MIIVFQTEPLTFHKARLSLWGHAHTVTGFIVVHRMEITAEEVKDLFFQETVEWLIMPLL